MTDVCADTRMKCSRTNKIKYCIMQNSIYIYITFQNSAADQENYCLFANWSRSVLVIVFNLINLKYESTSTKMTVILQKDNILN